MAVGYTLDEIRNDITRETPASFEPTIDYVVTKVPRFTFEKFPDASDELTTQMKSLGEVMAIGRTFRESLQKALRLLEIDHAGFEPPEVPAGEEGLARLFASIDVPRPDRLWALAEAFRRGVSLAELQRRSAIDPWFLGNLREIVELEADLAAAAPAEREAWLLPAKQAGFSDRPEPVAPAPAETAQEVEPPAKAIYADDLSRWERKALRVLKENDSAVCEYVSDVLPPEIRKKIETGLPGCKTPEEVKEIFKVYLVAKSTRTPAPEYRSEILPLAAALNKFAAKATMAGTLPPAQPITFNLPAQMPAPGEPSVTFAPVTAVGSQSEQCPGGCTTDAD